MAGDVVLDDDTVLVPDIDLRLTYDLRNHGTSGAANGGESTSGWFEARDVVGSLRFARTDPRMSQMAVALFSRCLGGTPPSPP